MQPDSPQKQPQNEQPWRIMLQRIWNAVHRRPLLKLAALLIAAAFWAIVIASDPTRLIERTIMNVPVAVSGQETLRSRGLTVMDDISTGTITVKMRVEVKQSDYDRATAENFSARLDLSSQISTEGKNQRVNFTAAPSAYGTVLSFEPEYVELDVELFTSRSRVPVVVEQTGQSREALWLDSPTPDPSQVAVSGPKSLVDQIRRAVVTLPKEDLSASKPQDSVTSKIELQDASGNVISSPQIRISNDSITVVDARIDVMVYPVKDVPVDLESALIGVPGHGYTLQNVTITPETVAVAADEDILGSIESLYVATPLNIAGQTETMTSTVTLNSVSGAARMTATEVTIEAEIVPAEHVHVYNDLPILVMGAASDLSIKLSHEQMDAVIRGDYDDVQGLAKKDITLYVDATGLEEGVHMVDVLCIVNGTEEFIYDAEFPRVTLTLSKI